MQYKTGVLLCALAALIWSLNGLTIRQIEAAGPWSILFWRGIGTALTLLAWITYSSNFKPLAQIKACGWAGLIGGASLSLAFAGAIYAMQATTVANFVFVYAASPLIAALLGWLILGEAVRPTTKAAIALALLGVLIMVSEGIGMGAMAGNIASLCAALGFAGFTIALRAGKVKDAMPVSLIATLLAIVLGAVMVPLSGETYLAPPADIFWAMVMGVVILACGLILYTLGSRVLSAVEATLLSQGETILSPLWVWLFVGEAASAMTFLGGAVIMLALLLNAFAGLRRSALA